MANFSKSNKISGSYFVKGPIENFSFKVKLKSASLVIPLPILDAIGDASATENVENDTAEELEKVFQWQEEIASDYRDGKRLFSQVNENHLMNDEKREIMRIAADFMHSKKELILFTLLWSESDRCLTVSPNFNDFALNPYVLENNQIFHYGIEMVAKNRDKKTNLLKKDLLSEMRKSLSNQSTALSITNFVIPPRNVMRYFTNFEIVSAERFDYDLLYVEYEIRFPEGFKCNNCSGSTQVSSVKRETAAFGHIFEIVFESAVNFLSFDHPIIYFEVISIGTWGRRRTEGYCSTVLPVTQPGSYIKTLTTLQPQPKNKRVSDMTRFFIGGHHILNDITWIGLPSNQRSETFNKYGIRCASSGNLNIKMHVMKQSQSHLSANMGEPNLIINNISTETLFKSVNNALAAYKKVRQKLINLQDGEK